MEPVIYHRMTIPDLRKRIVDNGLTIGNAHSKEELIEVLTGHTLTYEDDKIKVPIIPPLPERLVNMDQLPVIRPFRDTMRAPIKTQVTTTRPIPRVASPVRLPSAAQQKSSVKPPQIKRYPRPVVKPTITPKRRQSEQEVKATTVCTPKMEGEMQPLPTNVTTKVPTFTGEIRPPVIRRPPILPKRDDTSRVKAPTVVKPTLAPVKSPRRTVIRSPKTPTARGFTAPSPRIASPRVVKYK